MTLILADIDGFNLADVHPKKLSLLLFDNQTLRSVANRIILQVTISSKVYSLRGEWPSGLYNLRQVT